MSDEYVKLERFERDLECEHREVEDDGSLTPCDLEADYTLTSPLWSGETRTRRCSIHVWNELERWVDKLED